MSTCVLYVDESGDINSHSVPITNGKTPIFTLTGVALPLEEWRNLDREYLGLKRNFFKPELDRSTKRPEQFEVKGNSLTSPRNKRSDRRHQFLKELCDMVNRYGGKLFCVSMIKNPVTPTPPTTIYTHSLQIMVERYNCFVAEHKYFDKGIIIADSTLRFDQRVAKSHMSFIFGHETGRQLTCIYEAPLFADSKLTVGLQIADNLSSMIFTNHYHHHCKDIEGAVSYEHMTQHWPTISSLEFRSRNRYDGGYIKFGFKVLNHNTPS